MQTSHTVLSLRRWIALVTILFILPWSTAAERLFWVSPSGNDKAPGTQEAPFQTLPRAQAAVREAVPGMDGDVVVNLEPGV